MVNILNSVCSLMEYCVTLSVFLDEQHHLSAESPHSSEWEKHCSNVREEEVWQARGPFTLLCMVNRVSIWKERFVTVSILKVKNVNFVQNSLFQVNGETL
jgi:L-lactate permease